MLDKYLSMVASRRLGPHPNARSVFRPASWAVFCALPWLATGSAWALQVEAPLYVIVSGVGLNHSVGQITGYADGAAPTFTLLMDLDPASSGQAAFPQGLAWDHVSERPVVASFDGFRESFIALDLAAGSASLLFQDLLPVQLQGFAVAPDGFGYAQHLSTTEVLRVDFEGERVDVVGDFGASAGSALAISPDGVVYALDSQTGLIRFDPGTSQAQWIGSTYLWGASGMDFTEDGRLFAVLRGGQLFEIDPASAAIDLVGFVEGLGFGSSSTYDMVAMCIASERPAGWETLCGGNEVSLLPVGNARVTANDLRFVAHGMPGSVFALGVVSDGVRPPVTSPQFSGELCLDSGLVRLVSMVAQTTPDGRLNMPIDLLDVPALGGGAPVAPGDQRYFQVWYRNQLATGQAQFTTAVEVTFR